VTLPPTTSPEAVLQRALAFKERLQYDGVAALCDSASLRQWLDYACEQLRPPTADEIRARHSNIAEEKQPALLQYMLARSAEARAFIPRMVPGTASFEELLALTPAEFARRCLEADDIRCQIVRGLRRRGDVVPDGCFAPPPGYEYRITQTVALSDWEVRVHYAGLYEGAVCRGEDMEEYEDLRRLETGEWRLVAHSGLLQSRGGTVNIVSKEIADLISE
jgi:hypothetical protein